MNLNFVFIVIVLTFTSVNGAVTPYEEEVDEQGLYSKSDHVEILTQRNFDKKVYGQKHAVLVQFYNSYCGHCRAFAPKFKMLASQITTWKNILKLAVLDCSVEENNEICRQFEVLAYPTLRYLHENYIKGNTNVGERMQVTDTAEKLKDLIIYKLKSEQSMGRLSFAPSLSIASYLNYENALQNNPKDIKYTFLVFENENSTAGSEVALNVNNYNGVIVKRVYDTSELAHLANVQKFPGIVAVGPESQPLLLEPKEHTATALFKVLNSYLKSKQYAFPDYQNEIDDKENNQNNQNLDIADSDIVYYSDLEKTLKTSLHTEITRYKILEGEPLQALIEFLDVLVSTFPFRGNMMDFIMDLRATLLTRNKWNGGDVYEMVKRLESAHSPVYVTNLEYIRCKGSEPKYRGYSCGLWTLFHTMTVNAAEKPGFEGPKVLKAMHGYIKNFFGCTDCAQHFQEMAVKNRLFDVKENNKAVLWLWISHNDVNLRIAGDVTEDPQHPKIQFPSVNKCPDCRLARGAWNLPAVYQYLQKVYLASNIQNSRANSVAASSPLSNLDITMLSLQSMAG